MALKMIQKIGDMSYSIMNNINNSVHLFSLRVSEKEKKKREPRELKRFTIKDCSCFEQPNK